MALAEPVPDAVPDPDALPAPSPGRAAPGLAGHPSLRGLDGAGLDRLGERVRPVALAREHLLPVASPLERLLPWAGLRRGVTVGVGGGAAVSLALALVAEATRSGSWAVAVGLPWLGLAAAAELGVALDHLAVVTFPAPTPTGAGPVRGGARGRGDHPPNSATTWPTVVATVVEAFDLVLVRAPVRVRPADARRLGARTREQGAVLVQVGDRAQVGGRDHGLDLDLRLQATSMRWEGLGDGHGHLRARRVRVEATGRREASRPRRADLWLPATPPSPFFGPEHTAGVASRPKNGRKNGREKA